MDVVYWVIEDAVTHGVKHDIIKLDDDRFEAIEK